MRYMATYDFMETLRVTNQWLGATAQAIGSYPSTGLFPNPVFQLMSAWGDVTERSFARMVAKPDWGINVISDEDGRDHVIQIETVIKRPFGDLIRFKVVGRKEKKRRVLLVAPMSGHYATLLRSTVQSLLPDAEVYITDWHNARDIPVSRGKFDVEDYTIYLTEFMRALGPTTNVIAVCQPVPLALAATAYLAEYEPEAQPRSLTLIGGPVDPDAEPTEVTDFGRRVTMGQLEQFALQRVGFKYAGAGRMVYPGLMQLAGFMSMNAERHARAFTNQVIAVSKGEASDHDKHNRFYDEYLAVMDMTAEFYLSTVERVFKTREIARNAFSVNGRAIDLGKITRVPVKIVEGEKDDISAPGQCLAALDLLTGLPDAKKAAHVEPGAGHYGIFAGKSWRNNIRPLVLEFIDSSNPRKAAPAVKPADEEPAKPKAANTDAVVKEPPAPTVKPTPKAAVKPTAKAAAKPASKPAAKTKAAPTRAKRKTAAKSKG